MLPQFLFAWAILIYYDDDIAYATLKKLNAEPLQSLQADSLAMHSRRISFVFISSYGFLPLLCNSK